MRALVRWLGWWLVLFGIWLAFVGIVAYTEAAVGAVAAALAATAMESVRSRALQSLLPEPRIASRALRVPRSVVVESWTVIRVLGAAMVQRRAPHGRLQSVPFEAPGARRDECVPRRGDGAPCRTRSLRDRGGSRPSNRRGRRKPGWTDRGDAR